MIAIAVTALAVLLTYDGAPAPRKQFLATNTPGGSRVEEFGTDGVKLRVPAGHLRGIGGTEDANIDRLPWASRRVEGDFVAMVRVRLLFPPEAGAFGVTRLMVTPAGTESVAIPGAVGGLHLTAGTREWAAVYAKDERKGDRRLVHMGFNLSSAMQGVGGAAGGSATSGVPTWLAFRRVGEAVEVRGGCEEGGRINWCDWMKHQFPLPGVLDIRLFATGNLDRPYSVEFDRLTVEPLPAEKK